VTTVANEQLRWRKSRRSGAAGNGNDTGCVEIAWLDEHGARAVRDHKLQDASPQFTMSAANWTALRTAALNGTLDIS
jgi:hypothetical protein